jgi:hypothetical protein
MKAALSIVAIFLFWNMCQAKISNDTVFVKNYGAKPYSYENCTLQIQEALKACKEKKAKVLSFENGRYDLWPENSIQKEYFITNTSSEQECPSKVKTIGVMLDNMEGLTIEGNGATLMFHGLMTTLVMDNCTDIVLENIHIDFERPAGSEITFTSVGDGLVNVKMHKDTRYDIVDGHIRLIGEGWVSKKNHCIEFNPKEDSFKYTNSWNILNQSKAEEITRGEIRFYTPNNFKPINGNTMTIRDIIRSQVGLFILQSRNVTLNKVYIHYMHGLGIVSQYSENITMSNIECTPREGSGRILASSADFLHFSGCSGKVSVLNSKFSGAQDDCINVHGTNLRIVEVINGKKLNFALCTLRLTDLKLFLLVMK